jgi:DNA-binding transcriptional regulator GbsR (MarR family)
MARPAETTTHAKSRLDRRIDDVCDAAGAFIAYWGFKHVLGRAWAHLALHVGPMSQIDLAERMDVSRSLMSGVIAELEKRGLVRAVSQHRNAPFDANMDVWPTIAEVLRSREWMLLERARNALEAAIEEADIAVNAGELIPYDVGRMRLLLAMTDAAQSFLRLLISMRLPRAVESFGGWVAKAATIIQSIRRGE